MTTSIIVVLTLLFLRMAYLLGRALKVQNVMEIKCRTLEEINAVLESQSIDAHATLSDFADNEAAIKFAIECGYIGAFSSHDLKEDHARRAQALEISLAYYRKHVAGAVAAANH